MMFKMNAVILSLIVVGTIGMHALASSHRRFFYGDDAAMTGSAGTAIIQDTGAIWYNPAGLGGNQFRKVQISGTVYGVRLRSLNGILKTDVDSSTHREGASLNTLMIVPSAFSLAFQLNDRVSLGIALYQSENNSLHLRIAQQFPVAASGKSWSNGLEYHEEDIRYTAGWALGFEISDNLKWGIANFGTYESAGASIRLHSGFLHADPENPAVDTFTIDSQYVDVQGAGTMFTTGLQWQVNNNWFTGVLYRSPIFVLWARQNFSSFNAAAPKPAADTAAAGGGENLQPFFRYSDSDDAKVDFKMSVPMEVVWSIVYRRGNSWAGADAGWQFPYKKNNHRGVFNASVGAHLAVSRRFNFGVGFFTDNDSQKKFDGTLTKAGNRFGVTGGIQFLSAELVEQLKPTDASKSKSRRRVLATTLSFSYSFQSMAYRQIHFFTDSDTEIVSAQLDIDRAVFHQMAIQLGGGFYF